MHLNEYNKHLADIQKHYPHTNSDRRLAALALGLAGEVGEVSELIKRHFRGDFEIEQGDESLKLELGDVLAYVALVANHFGMTLEEVAMANVYKMQLRAKNNALLGNGGDR